MNAIQNREVSAAMAQLRAEIEQLPKDKSGKRHGISRDLKQRIVDTLLGSRMGIETFAMDINATLRAILSKQEVVMPWDWPKKTLSPSQPSEDTS